nr:HK97 family phage prohead protease [Desulfuromonadales bacterium]
MTAQVLTFPFEVKQIGEREFEGYGSTFGNVDLGDDIVVRGAFKRTLAEHRKAGTMPLMFWMHDPRQVPGVW